MRTFTISVLGLLHVLVLLSLVTFVCALVSSILFTDLRKSHDTELGMVIIFSFGALFSSLGIIGFINGSMQSSTVGEIPHARQRFPFQWFIGNLVQVAFGIGFIVWGIRIFSRWLVA